MLANTQARLCSTLLVHQVNTPLGDFRKVIDRLSLYGTGRQRRQPPKGSHRLLLGQTGTDQDTAEVLGNIGSVVGLHVVKGQRLYGCRQPTLGIGQGMGRAVHYGVDGPSRQAGRGFALLHQAFNGLGLEALEVLGQECRLEDALHHQVHTLVQMLGQYVERHGGFISAHAHRQAGANTLELFGEFRGTALCGRLTHQGSHQRAQARLAGRLIPSSNIKNRPHRYRGGLFVGYRQHSHAVGQVYVPDGRQFHHRVNARDRLLAAIKVVRHGPQG